MTSTVYEEFQVSREVIAALDGWLRILAAPQIPLIKVKASDAPGDFHSEFRNHDASALLVGKAVRMVSGIHAAMLLADEGFPVECFGLLRMVSDFAQEIMAIGEGVLEQRMTPPQRQFVDQYFAPIPKDHDEYAKAERQFYVSREDLYKSQYRMAEKATQQGELLRTVTRFLNFGFDKYVHGHHLTATELYNRHEHRFIVNGTMPEVARCRARRTVAGKVLEVVLALRLIAMASNNWPLSDELGRVTKRLEESGEQTHECLPTRKGN